MCDMSECDETELPAAQYPARPIRRSERSGSSNGAGGERVQRPPAPRASHRTAQCLGYARDRSPPIEQKEKEREERQQRPATATGTPYHRHTRSVFAPAWRRSLGFSFWQASMHTALALCKSEEVRQGQEAGTLATATRDNLPKRRARRHALDGTEQGHWYLALGRLQALGDSGGY